MPSPKLGIQLLATGQQPDITVNEAIVFLESLSNLAFEQFALNTPPGSPADGDTYFTGPAATGLWSGQNNRIAIYFSGWRFFTPVEGLLAYDKEDDEWLGFSDDGSEWHPIYDRWSTTEYWTGQYRTPINNQGGTAKKLYARVLEFTNVTQSPLVTVTWAESVDMTYPIHVYGSLNDASNLSAVQANSAYFAVQQYCGVSIARTGSNSFATFDGFGPFMGSGNDADVLVKYCKTGA